jgi:hypothetical protein
MRTIAVQAFLLGLTFPVWVGCFALGAWISSAALTLVWYALIEPSAHASRKENAPRS